MVFCKISKDIKDRAIDLHYQGLIPQDVRDLLGISTRSPSRWRRNHEDHGSTLPPPTYMAGRPRILNSEQVLSIREQIDRAPEMYLDEIQDWVALTAQCRPPSRRARYLRSFKMQAIRSRCSIKQHPNETRKNGLYSGTGLATLNDCAAMRHTAVNLE